MRKSKLIGMGTAIVLSVAMLIQPVSAANWVHNSVGWWWQEDNGSYPVNQWKNIGGQWYWFDGNGYMAIGWRNIGGQWYYMSRSGAMQTGWLNQGGTWYYLQASGAMAVNTWIGDNYVNSSGVWVPGKTKEQPRWVQSGSKWWYRHADGSYKRSNWEKIDGAWYYFDQSGWMQTGWLNQGGTWYYLQASGVMAEDTTIGDYYVDKNGVWSHTHTWKEKEVSGHYETKIENVYEERLICGCGKTFTSYNEWELHIVNTGCIYGYSAGKILVSKETQVWVVDSSYTYCPECGWIR